MRAEPALCIALVISAVAVSDCARAVAGVIARHKAAHSKPRPKHRAAAGYFQIGQDGGRSWLVDPTGRRTLLVATDHVNYKEQYSEQLGYAPYHRNVEAKYGSAEEWAKVEAGRLRSWHFNSLGINCSPELRHKGLAYTEIFAFGVDFADVAALVPKVGRTGFPDVYDPRWKPFCEQRAKERATPLREDTSLIGYFLDNELYWFGHDLKPWGMADDAWRLSASHSAKHAFVDFLSESYGGDIGRFNRDFGASFSGFEALSDSSNPLPPLNSHGKSVLMEFVTQTAEHYFQDTTAAIQAADPNHLILGCRFAGDAPDPVWMACGSYCDVVSFNVYPTIDLFTGKVDGLSALLERGHNLSHKPIAVTEWSFPGLDAVDSRGNPIRSTHGAGMRVDTQGQRGICFADMQLTLFETPFVIGSSYFMWADDPSAGISRSFPEDSNYGLVNEADQPYTELVQSATTVNDRLSSIHTGLDSPALPHLPAERLASMKTYGAKPDFRRTAGGYEVTNGVLRLVKDAPDGFAFNHVLYHSSEGQWQELGSYRPEIREAVGAGSRWVTADRVTATVVPTEDQELHLRLTFDKTAHPGDDAQPFRCAVDVTAFPDSLCFIAKFLSIENSGVSPLNLEQYLHYAPSKMGASDFGDDLGGPQVLSYWRPIGIWQNRALNLQYGIVGALTEVPLLVSFWKDGNGREHPDCFRALGQTLQPGERWTALPEEPVATIFGGPITPVSALFKSIR